MGRWVALLRGINVGGKNLIRMEALRACVEALGHTNVATYIQSGNVVFDAKAKDAIKIEGASRRRAPSESERVRRTSERIERALEAALVKQFAYRATVMLRSHEQLKKVVSKAPRGFGKKPAQFRYDVIFLKEPPSAEELLPDVPAREGVDQVWAGDGVLYYSRVEKLASKSRVAKIVGTPMYQRMTIRNWNTTTKLLALMEK